MIERHHKSFLKVPTATVLAVVLFGSLFFTCRPAGGTSQDLPDRLARVIYRQNPDSEQHIYIVAQSHRSALSGLNSPDTERVQAEIYRIGEWLIKNRGVALLLPEGYFKRRTTAISAGAAGGSNRGYNPVNSISDATLLAKLSDADRFENANTLLHANYDVPLCQIEDWDLYANTRRLQGELSRETGSDPDLPALAAALNYQQKKRSAALLRNIPAVLDQALEPGNRRPKKALLTIGMAHIEEIIRFLMDGRAHIEPLTGMEADFAGYDCDLNALGSDYGITVILPRALNLLKLRGAVAA